MLLYALVYMLVGALVAWVGNWWEIRQGRKGWTPGEWTLLVLGWHAMLVCLAADAIFGED